MAKHNRQDDMQPIFVLELAPVLRLAFEAANRRSAEKIIRSQAFSAGVATFLDQSAGHEHNSQGHLRIASECDALIYREFSDEFAETRHGTLVVRLPQTPSLSRLTLFPPAQNTRRRQID